MRMGENGDRRKRENGDRGQAPFMNAPREWPYAAHPTRSLSEAPMRRICSSRTESKGMKTGPVPIFPPFSPFSILCPDFLSPFSCPHFQGSPGPARTQVHTTPSVLHPFPHCSAIGPLSGYGRSADERYYVHPIQHTAGPSAASFLSLWFHKPRSGINTVMFSMTTVVWALPAHQALAARSDGSAHPHPAGRKTQRSTQMVRPAVSLAGRPDSDIRHVYLTKTYLPRRRILRQFEVSVLEVLKLGVGDY